MAIRTVVRLAAVLAAPAAGSLLRAPPSLIDASERVECPSTSIKIMLNGAWLDITGYMSPGTCMDTCAA
jgi:hypothetical protein